MVKKKRFLEGKVSLPFPSLLFLFFLLLCDRSYPMLLTLLCALLHELGHLWAARLCRVRIKRMVIYPLGADLLLDEEGRSYGKDAFIALAGAGVNLCLAGVGALFGGGSGGLFDGRAGEYLVGCNLFLAAMNLLPIEGLDGGMVLSSLCSLFCSPRTLRRILRISSFLCLFALYLLGVYFLLLYDGDPSLFLIVCFLFASLFLSGRKEGK